MLIVLGDFEVFVVKMLGQCVSKEARNSRNSFHFDGFVIDQGVNSSCCSFVVSYVSIPAKTCPVSQMNNGSASVTGAYLHDVVLRVKYAYEIMVNPVTTAYFQPN
jgi:hypothetical protein